MVRPQDLEPGKRNGKGNDRGENIQVCVGRVLDGALPICFAFLFINNFIKHPDLQISCLFSTKTTTTKTTSTKQKPTKQKQSKIDTWTKNKNEVQFLLINYP